MHNMYKCNKDLMEYFHTLLPTSVSLYSTFFLLGWNLKKFPIISIGYTILLLFANNFHSKKLFKEKCCECLFFLIIFVRSN